MNAIGDRLINPPSETPYERDVRTEWLDQLQETAERLPFIAEPELKQFSDETAAVDWNLSLSLDMHRDPERALLAQFATAFASCVQAGVREFKVLAHRWPVAPRGEAKRRFRVTVKVEEIRA